MRTKRIIIILNVIFALTNILNFSFAQGAWMQKSDFEGLARRGAVNFVIDNNAYIGTGLRAGLSVISCDDFWKYDPTSDTWEQIASIPTSNYGATGFSIGNKGYVVTGAFGNYELWEYNPDSDTWTQKADFPGATRMYAVSFSIDGKGYCGTGGGGPVHLNDFWEYDPNSDTWTQKTDFGGIPRLNAKAFVINHKGYIGTGEDSNGYLNDFWEYNPVSDTWTQISDFSGLPRSGAVGFSINTKGYIGVGRDSNNYFNDFWEYDPIIDTWIQKENISDIDRIIPFGFSINSKGYIGAGFDGSVDLKDFWEYDPLISKIEETTSNDEISIYPNPANNIINIEISKSGKIQLINLQEQVLKEVDVLDKKTTNIDITDLSCGIYLIKVKTYEGTFVKRFIKQ